MGPGKMAQSMKCLLEDLSLDPQHLYAYLGMVVNMWGRWRHEDFLEFTASRFSQNGEFRVKLEILSQKIK